MARGISNKLAILVRERAYVSGARSQAEHRVQHGRQVLAEAEAELEKIVARIAELDAQIKKAELDPEEIRAVVYTPRTGGFSHGKFTLAMVNLLREADRPLKTSEIIAHMIETFGFPYTTPKDKDETRRRVVKRLRVISDQGAIQRLHDTSDNKEGIWMWTGM
ncbi:MAG TPA: hypothetical protein VF801_04865 [Rhodocyclaceae bacterium]